MSFWRRFHKLARPAECWVPRVHRPVLGRCCAAALSDCSAQSESWPVSPQGSRSTRSESWPVSPQKVPKTEVTASIAWAGLHLWFFGSAEINQLLLQSLRSYPSGEGWARLFCLGQCVQLEVVWGCRDASSRSCGASRDTESRQMATCPHLSSLRFPQPF